jgi:hypothetical protein
MAEMLLLPSARNHQRRQVVAELLRWNDGTLGRGFGLVNCASRRPGGSVDSLRPAVSPSEGGNGARGGIFTAYLVGMAEAQRQRGDLDVFLRSGGTSRSRPAATRTEEAPDVGRDGLPDAQTLPRRPGSPTNWRWGQTRFGVTTIAPPMLHLQLVGSSEFTVTRSKGQEEIAASQESSSSCGGCTRSSPCRQLCNRSRGRRRHVARPWAAGRPLPLRSDPPPYSTPVRKHCGQKPAPETWPSTPLTLSLSPQAGRGERRLPFVLLGLALLLLPLSPSALPRRRECGS